MTESLIVPGAEPYFLPGGPVGCLLLHGFTAMPAELRPLADDLAHRGYTVFAQRLAGHATHPADLERTCWSDWLISVEDGLALLNGVCERVFLVGQSLGGAIALLAAARYPVSGVVAMSTPGRRLPEPALAQARALRERGGLIVKENVASHPSWPERREHNYPAYPQFPGGILLEVDALLEAMLAALPEVHVPVLLLHSRTDTAVPPDSMEQLVARLGTADKEMRWLEGMNHALVNDPQRELVFEAVAAFLSRRSG